MEYLKRLWSKSPQNIAARNSPANLQSVNQNANLKKRSKRSLRLHPNAPSNFLSPSTHPHIKNYDEYLMFSSEWYLNMNPVLLYKSGEREKEARSGKVIFSLRDIPIATTFFTERGTPIVRIDESYILLGTTVIPIPISPPQVTTNEEGRKVNEGERGERGESVNAQGNMLIDMRKELEEERQTILIEKHQVEEEWEKLKQEKLALQEERDCAIRLAKEKKKEQEMLEKIMEETKVLEKKKLEEEKIRKSQERDRENLENLLLMEGKGQAEPKITGETKSEGVEKVEEKNEPKQKTEKEIEREERVRQKEQINSRFSETQDEREKCLEKKRQSIEWRKAITLPSPLSINPNPELKNFEIQESILPTATLTKNDSSSNSNHSTPNTTPKTIASPFKTNLNFSPAPPKLRQLSLFRAKVPKEKRKKPSKKLETIHKQEIMHAPQIPQETTFNEYNQTQAPAQSQIMPTPTASNLPQSVIEQPNDYLTTLLPLEMPLDTTNKETINPPSQDTNTSDTNDNNTNDTNDNNTNDTNDNKQQALKERLTKIGGVGMPLFDPSSIKLKSKTNSFTKEDNNNNSNSAKARSSTNTIAFPKLKQTSKENKEYNETNESGIKQLDFRGLLKKPGNIGEGNQ